MHAGFLKLEFSRSNFIFIYIGISQSSLIVWMALLFGFCR